MHRRWQRPSEKRHTAFSDGLCHICGRRACLRRAGNLIMTAVFPPFQKAEQ
ncbi:hypothetical protein HMPREF9123_2125 [Neisseria bacilliformis ATCC BAA-1200]|uniref:Uncharacterized protein n=1 Tax=Neisseria bacilliformis ATCC BAA-1200 TaxID=888742 RepID=F2BEG9_9NEIS|nr:hypothetical protein HMPREF9123_2125 [Neisseria bacilliformis ATCC BAA-1200]